MKAKLIDLSRCTGCRSCIVACENENGLEPHTIDPKTGEVRSQQQVRANMENYAKTNGKWDQAKNLSADEFTIIAQKDPKNFYKKQCMHCDDPQCVKNCPAHAIIKYDNGAVVVDPDKCEGVQLCVEACPFGVPIFDETEKTIKKCTLCYNRITQSPALEPACVQACPAKAITFGEKDALLKSAKSNKNLKYIYGGGEEYDSSVIYASAVPFNQIGFEKAQIHGIPELLRSISHPVGVAMVAAGAGLAALHALGARSKKVAEEESQNKNKNSKNKKKFK